MDELRHRIFSEENGLLLAKASPELQDIDDIVELATNYNIEALRYTSERLTSDWHFMLKIIEKNEQAFGYISATLKTIDFLLAAIDRNPSCIKYVKPYLNEKNATRINSFLQSKGLQPIDLPKKAQVVPTKARVIVAKSKITPQKLLTNQNKLGKSIETLLEFIEFINDVDDIRGTFSMTNRLAKLLVKLLKDSRFNTQITDGIRNELSRILRGSKEDEDISWRDPSVIVIGLFESIFNQLEHMTYSETHKKIKLVHNGLLEELRLFGSRTRTLSTKEQFLSWTSSLLPKLLDLQTINDFEWYITNNQISDTGQPYDSDEDADFKYIPHSIQSILIAQINSDRFDRFTDGSNTYSIPASERIDEPTTVDLLARAFQHKRNSITRHKRTRNNPVEKYKNAYKQHIISEADLITIINDDIPFDLTVEPRRQLLLELQDDLSQHLITKEQLREIIHGSKGGKKTYKYKKQRTRKIKLNRK